MNNQDYYNKTDELLSKFKNGKELYRKSATFNRVIQMLVRDADHFEIIEHLITITEDTQKAFEQYITRNPPQSNFNPCYY